MKTSGVLAFMGVIGAVGFAGLLWDGVSLDVQAAPNATSSSNAQHGVIEPTPNNITALDGRFGGLSRLAGYAYEIDGAWMDGAPIKARNEYRADLGGQALVSRVYTTDAAGDVYQRYFTVWTRNPSSGDLSAYGVTNDGSAELVGATMSENDDGTTTVASSWSNATPGGAVRQEIQLNRTGTAYDWRVWVKPAGTDRWTQMMDGRWERVAALDE